MVTVAIIHAAEDALPARALAEKLRAAKLTVLLEKAAGEEQRNAAKDAKVTIALWSPRSVGQPAIAEDVNFARGKSKVVHATMQNAAAPSAFGGDKIVNLTGWRGEDDFVPWQELAKLVTDKAGVAPLPPPAPRPASGFFQPGIVKDPSALTATHAPRPPRTPAPAAPQQRAAQQPRPQAAPRPQPAPRPAPASGPVYDAEPKKSGNGMMMGIIAFVVVALAGGGGYFWWSQQQSQASTTAWDSVAQNDADALRAFLAGDPGEYRDEAQTALASLEERSYEAASDADSIETLEAFLNDFPESEHAVAARGRINELRIAAAEAPPEGEVLPPAEGAAPVDPDLVPPGSTAPDTSGGPPSIAPPAAPAPEPAPAGDLPTN
jgi:hypothetical protein